MKPKYGKLYQIYPLRLNYVLQTVGDFRKCVSSVLSCNIDAEIISEQSMEEENWNLNYPNKYLCA